MSAIDVLREIEWGSWVFLADGTGLRACPACLAAKDSEPHEHDCALAAALREPDPVARAYRDAATMALDARAPGMRDLRLEQLAQALFDKGIRARSTPPVQQTRAPSSATVER